MFADFCIPRQNQASSVAAVATPFVCALVVVWGQKLTDQVTVGSVNLNATETGFLADRRAAGKALNDLPNLGACRFTWRIEKSGHVLSEGHSRRSELEWVKAFG